MCVEAPDHLGKSTEKKERKSWRDPWFGIWFPAQSFWPIQICLSPPKSIQFHQNIDPSNFPKTSNSHLPEFQNQPIKFSQNLKFPSPWISKSTHQIFPKPQIPNLPEFQNLKFLCFPKSQNLKFPICNSPKFPSCHLPNLPILKKVLLSSLRRHVSTRVSETSLKNFQESVGGKENVCLSIQPVNRRLDTAKSVSPKDSKKRCIPQIYERWKIVSLSSTFPKPPGAPNRHLFLSFFFLNWKALSPCFFLN